MTARLNSTDDCRAVLADLGMTAREDDWSIQISCQRDHLFWLRIEKSRSDNVIVTDFKAANVPPIDAAKSLSAVLKVHGARHFQRLVFLDIAPSGQAIDKVEAAIHSMVSAFAAITRTFIDEKSVKLRNGKTDLIYAISR